MAPRRSPALHALHRQIAAVRDTLRKKFDGSGVTTMRRKLLSDFHKLATANKILGLPVLENFEPRKSGGGRRPAGKTKAGKKR